MIRFLVTGTARDHRYQYNILVAPDRYDHRHVEPGERVTILLERRDADEARIAGTYDHHLSNVTVRPAP